MKNVGARPLAHHRVSRRHHSDRGFGHRRARLGAGQHLEHHCRRPCGVSRRVQGCSIISRGVIDERAAAGVAFNEPAQAGRGCHVGRQDRQVDKLADAESYRAAPHEVVTRSDRDHPVTNLLVDPVIMPNWMWLGLINPTFQVCKQFPIASTTRVRQVAGREDMSGTSGALVPTCSDTPSRSRARASCRRVSGSSRSVHISSSALRRSPFVAKRPSFVYGSGESCPMVCPTMNLQLAQHNCSHRYRIPLSANNIS
jgi:hypothetical protein